MTVTLQRMVRCFECGRPTGATFEQDADAPPRRMPEAWCDNCDMDKLPAPWRPQYEDEDENMFEEDATPAPCCSHCAYDYFEIRFSGETLASFQADEYWCYDCGRFENLMDAVPQQRRQTFTADQRAQVVLNCESCGTELHGYDNITW